MYSCYLLLDRQTSPASGNVIQMGKGYVQWQEAVDTDLKSHFEAAFARIVCFSPTQAVLGMTGANDLIGLRPSYECAG